MALGEELKFTLRLVAEDFDRGIAKTTASMEGLKLKTSVLNETASASTTRLSDLHAGISGLGQVAEKATSGLDGLASRVGDHLEKAAKRGLIAVGALAAGVATAAVNIQKETQTAQDTLVTFLGGPSAANNKTASTLTSQMHESAWIAPLTTQTQGMKQLLTNPNYRGGASDLNDAILRIAAGSPGQSQQVYSSLTSVIGRAEGMGRINGRIPVLLQRAGVSMADFAKQMGIQDYNTPEGAKLFQSELSKLTTPQQLVDFIEKTSKNPQFATAEDRYANTITGSIAKVKNDVMVAIADNTSDFGPAINKASKPLAQLAGTVTKDLVPPLVSVSGTLLGLAGDLAPVITPTISALAGGADGKGGLAGAITAIGKDIDPKELKEIGTEVGGTVGKLVDAAVPLLPTLARTGMDLVKVLPPFLSDLTDLAVPLVKVADGAMELADAVLKVPGAPQLLAGVGTGLVGLMVASKVASGVEKVTGALKTMHTTLDGINDAGGLWDWLKNLGSGGKEGKDPLGGTGGMTTATDSLTTAGTELQEAAAMLKDSAAPGGGTEGPLGGEPEGPLGGEGGALGGAAEDAGGAGGVAAAGGAGAVEAAGGAGAADVAADAGGVATAAGGAGAAAAVLAPIAIPAAVAVGLAATQTPEDKRKQTQLDTQRKQAQGRTVRDPKTGDKVVPGYNDATGYLSPLEVSTDVDTYEQKRGIDPSSKGGQDFLKFINQLNLDPRNRKAIQSLPEAKGNSLSYDAKTHQFNIGNVHLHVDQKVTKRDFENMLKEWGNDRIVRQAKTPAGNNANSTYQIIGDRPTSSSNAKAPKGGGA